MSTIPEYKQFQICWHFIDWWQWSFGIHIDARWPHIQIYLPGGFLTVGWFYHNTGSYRRWDGKRWSEPFTTPRFGPFVYTSKFLISGER